MKRFIVLSIMALLGLSCWSQDINLLGTWEEDLGRTMSDWYNGYPEECKGQTMFDREGDGLTHRYSVYKPNGFVDKILVFRCYNLGSYNTCADLVVEAVDYETWKLDGHKLVKKESENAKTTYKYTNVTTGFLSEERKTKLLNELKEKESIMNSEKNDVYPWPRDYLVKMSQDGNALTIREESNGNKTFLKRVDKMDIPTNVEYPDPSPFVVLGNPKAVDLGLSVLWSDQDCKEDDYWREATEPENWEFRYCCEITDTFIYDGRLLCNLIKGPNGNKITYIKHLNLGEIIEKVPAGIKKVPAGEFFKWGFRGVDSYIDYNYIEKLRVSGPKTTKHRIMDKDNMTATKGKDVSAVKVFPGGKNALLEYANGIASKFGISVDWCNDPSNSDCWCWMVIYSDGLPVWGYDNGYGGQVTKTFDIPGGKYPYSAFLFTLMRDLPKLNCNDVTNVFFSFKVKK